MVTDAGQWRKKPSFRKARSITTDIQAEPDAPSERAWRLIGTLCLAQVLVQIGAFFWPVLLPTLMPFWQLSNTEAGWITAAFYGAYMLAVPILVTATDRIDPKRIYLLGVSLTVIGHALFALFADGFWSAFLARALTGVGWAGTYMTGLKLLADRVDGTTMSRATAGHAASIGLSGALSFAVGDLIAGFAGWQAAFWLATGCAAVALIIVAFVIPAAPRRKPGAGVRGTPARLFDFKAVFRNRSAMAYAIAYGVHTLEMSALRGWAVAFLTVTAATAGASGSSASPAIIVAVIGLAGTFASFCGNETAIRFGRRRLIHVAMIASIGLAVAIALIGPISYWLVVGLFLLYAVAIWLDSSSLTAGTVGTAKPERRGATLAMHSMLGYAGGLIGPVLVGVALDSAGGFEGAGWSAAFLVIAACALISFLVFLWLRPDEVAGDRSRTRQPTRPRPPAGTRSS